MTERSDFLCVKYLIDWRIFEVINVLITLNMLNGMKSIFLFLVSLFLILDRTLSKEEEFDIEGLHQKV